MLGRLSRVRVRSDAIEIVPGLLVADDTACPSLVMRKSLAVVHACKEPCHRRALGYRGREPVTRGGEYFAVRRGNHLYLNLVDAADVRFIATPAIDAALAFLREHAAAGRTVAVHCNRARSRAPSLALLHLAQTGRLPRECEAAQARFRALYPAYQPGAGISEWIRVNWERVIHHQGVI